MNEWMRLAAKLFLLLIAAPVSASGQGTLRLTFDLVPPMPPGYGTTYSSYYVESGIGVQPRGGGFTVRWPGGLLFPDNGTPYLQPGNSEELYFTYLGGRSFDAVSVDLALYGASSLDPVTVQFAAYLYTGRYDLFAQTEFIVSGVVDSQGRPAFQTFYFPAEFKGMHLLSVMPTTPLWSLDNLVLYIPEPSSLVLMCSGVLLLAALGLRRSRAKP